jgi:hypothetical protein
MLAQALELDRIRDRTWQIVPSNAKTGAQLRDSLAARCRGSSHALLPARRLRTAFIAADAGEGVEAGVQWLSDKLKDSPSTA